MRKLLQATLLFCVSNLYAQNTQSFLDFKYGINMEQAKVILSETGISVYSTFENGIAYFINFPTHQRMITLFFDNDSLVAGSILFKELKEDIIDVYYSVILSTTKVYGNPIQLTEEYSLPYKRGEEFDSSAIINKQVMIKSVWNVNNEIYIICYITSNLEINIITYTREYLIKLNS